MENIINLVPSSVYGFIGLLVIISFSLVFSAFFNEAGKLLWRKYVTHGQEKRHDDIGHIGGIERRSENIAIKNAIVDLMESLAHEKKVFTEFIDTWKESHHKMEDSLEEIKRKQNNNWKQLFEEEIPKILNK